MVIGSILYRIFFGAAFILGLILTHWQILRANRTELQPGAGRELKDFNVEARWSYERADRSQGQYWVLTEASKEVFCVEIEHLSETGDQKYRTVQWNVPRWMDKKNLLNQETRENSPTLSLLLKSLRERQGEKEVLILLPELSDRQKDLKRHRHYAYAYQWAGLALVSLYYLLRLRHRRT